MDEDTCRYVFEPFFSTKGEYGTGRGLATVYGIVKQHGGSIEVTSEAGRGTTFKIYLPGTEEAQTQTETATAEPVDLNGSETILLVEDNDQVRELAHAILVRHGYTVLVAENGREALDIFGTFEEPVHLLLTDVILPKMNGKDLYNQISGLNPDVRVLYMSGYTDDVIASQRVTGEGGGFIQKPFSIQSLTTKVRKILDR
jgi:CheY-like chemotaxis protein